MLLYKRVGAVCIALSMMSVHATYKNFNERNLLVEFKGSYVLPAAHLFRDIYHNAGQLSGEITAQLKAEQPWFGFATVGVIPLEGRSLGFCTKTRAMIVPLAAGLKYFLDFNRGDMYIGLGLLGAHLKTKDHSSFVISPRSNWGAGGIAKLGFIFDLSALSRSETCVCEPAWFIDLFSEYSFVKVGFPNKFECGVQSHKANISYWSLGLGIGYRFA